MKEYEHKSSISPVQVVGAALGIVGGIWMVAAPSVLNYGSATIYNATTKKTVPVDLGAVTASDITVGIVLIVLGIVGLLVTNSKLIYRVQMAATVAMVGAGLYLMLAPYLFDLLKVVSYMGLDKPNTNDQLMGMLVVVVGGFIFQRQYLGGSSEEEAEGQAPSSAITV